MEEEDLSDLSSRKTKGKSPKSAVQSPRKSPRLLAQEPIRSLRNSTIAKRPTPANLALVKRKEPVKYVSIGAGSAKLPDRHEKQSPQKSGGKGKPQQQNVSENAQSSAEIHCDPVHSEPVDSKNPELRSLETCIIPENTLELTCGNHKCTVAESVEQKVIESTSELQCSREPLIALGTENVPPDVMEDANELHCVEVQVASVSQNPIEPALESQCSAELFTETAQESTVEHVDAQKIVDCVTCGDEQAAVTDHSSVKSALESRLSGADPDGMPEDTTTVDADLHKNVCAPPHGNTNAAAEALKEIVVKEQNMQLNERTVIVDSNIINEQKEEPIELDPGVLSTETAPPINKVEDLPKLEENLQRSVDKEFPIPSELSASVNCVEAKENLDMQSSKGTTHNNASNPIKANISDTLELIEDSGNNKTAQLETGVTVSPKPESVTQKGELEVGRPVSLKIAAKDINEAGPHVACKKQDNINAQDNSSEQQLGPSKEEKQDLFENKDHEDIVPEKQVDAAEPKSQASKHEISALKPQHKLALDLKPEQTENFLPSNRKKAKLDIQSSEALKQSKPHTSPFASKRKAVDPDEHHPQKTVKCLKTQVGQDAKLKIDQAQKQIINKVSPVSQVAKMQSTSKIVSMTPAGHKSKKTIQTSKHTSNSTPKLSELPAKQVFRIGHKPVPSAGKIVSQQADNIKEKDKGRIVEHSNEDDKDKLKVRKNEKGILPRQRRSSKSLSLDEPPLFIPDNLPVIKKEETDMDHSAPVATSDLWDPKRLCGFCRKPHNSRFMVGCGRCDDWFHGECVGLTLSQAQQLEKEDKEYICLKCCAMEDKKAPSVNHSHTIKHQCVQHDMEKAKPELFNEHTIHLKSEKMMCSEQLNTTTNAAGVKSKTEIIEKTDQFPNKKHKVKMLRKVSGMRTGSTDSKDSETKDVKKAPLGNDRLAGQITGTSEAPEHKKSKQLKDLAASRLGQGDKLPKLDLKDKQAVKKKAEKGGTNSTPPPTSPSAPQPTVEQIRQNVRHSLMDILAKRRSESDLKVPEERAMKVAARIERKLFSFYGDTDTKYKSKYRRLMFNLKDPKNQVLFKRVLRGDIVPDHLIRMSPEELASKELAAWRQRENRHMIEMIEKEQRDVERRPITKITHKGEIEIESETPMKESETVVTEEAELKAVEPKPIVEKLEEPEDETLTDTTDDTTFQHKKHLFDLNCKICTGRMAPPAEELPLPKAKVATSVMRRQSDVDAEMAFLAVALSSASSILSFDATMEERPESPQPETSSVTRSDAYDIAEDESTFLARLDSLWKGFINMPSVAKFVTKAYPVSGSAGHLTEDLPDTIQVGGRIPPQMVWDYVDKIKASGTKEICVIRFCPVTEEDQITYTSLYAYFNSRQRYGVVANNVKQVKDMYLIPLGALEKIPYRLLPFDGPGLEVVRKNLLLGLIIRQRIKRLLSASPSEEVSEMEKLPSTLPQEKKSKPEFVEDEVENDDDDEENQFFNSFTSVLPKFRSKPKQVSPVEPQILKTPPSSPAEPIPILSTKPLRFLPGVLVGWENQSTSLELSDRPLDDILQSLLGDAEKETEQKSVPSTGPELGESPVSKDSKMPHTEETSEDQENAQDILHDPPKENEKADNVLEEVKVAETSKASAFLTTLTLKDKPPDVSTEAFLSSLAAIKSQPNHKEEHEKLRHHYKVKKVKMESSKEQKEALVCSPSQPVTPKIEVALLEPTTNPEEIDSTQEALARVSQVVNVNRDPRQAAVRKQQGITAVSRPMEDSAEELCVENRKDKSDDENMKDAEEVVEKPLETEQREVTAKQIPRDPVNTESQQSSEQVHGSTPCITEVSQSAFHNISDTVPETEAADSSYEGEILSDTEMIETHTIETVQSIRRETVPVPSFHSPCSGSHFEFSSNVVPTKNQTQVSALSTSLPSGGPSGSPIPSGNIFPTPLPQLHNFTQVQGHSSGFPFQRGLPNANFQPPGNLMPSFMSVRPPPLPPPPFGLQSDPHLRFHSPDLGVTHALGPNHMMPWLPPIPCPPQHHLGLMHLAHGQAMPLFTSDRPVDIRYGPNAGTSNFQLLKDDHRQGRHHCGLWDRFSQFSKEQDSHQRHRFYSDSYHQRKERHKERERDKYWDRDSERDRDKYKDRDREKGKDREKRSRREDTHRNKDRDRYRERSHDGADSRRERSKERERSHDEADSRRERSKERERSHDDADSRRERRKDREKSHDGVDSRKSKERENSHDGADLRRERRKERERSHDGADSRRARRKERERSHDGADSRRARRKERERSHDGVDTKRERRKERERSHDGADSRRERKKERERSHDVAESRRERRKEREKSHDGADSSKSKERERSHDGVDLRRERSKEKERSHGDADTRRELSKEGERSHAGAVLRREQSKERERSHDDMGRRERSKEKERSHDGEDPRRDLSKERESSHDGADLQSGRSKERERSHDGEDLRRDRSKERESSHDGEDLRREQSKESERSHDGEDLRRDRSKERESSHDGADLQSGRSKERERSHDGEDLRRDRSKVRESSLDGEDLRREQSKERERSHDGEDLRRDQSKERERSHDGEDLRREQSKERERSHDGDDLRREQSKERERSHDGEDLRRDQSKERERSHDGEDLRREQSKERERSHDGEDLRRERSKERERSHDDEDLRRDRSKERERSHDGEDLRRERSKERERSHDGEDLRRDGSKERESSHDGEDLRREQSKERERSHDGEDLRREQSKERERSHDGEDLRRDRSKERESSHDGEDLRRGQSKERARSHDDEDLRREQSKERERTHDGEDLRREQSKERERSNDGEDLRREQSKESESSHDGAALRREQSKEKERSPNSADARREQSKERESSHDGEESRREQSEERETSHDGEDLKRDRSKERERSHDGEDLRREQIKERERSYDGADVRRERSKERESNHDGAALRREQSKERESSHDGVGLRREQNKEREMSYDGEDVRRERSKERERSHDWAALRREPSKEKERSLDGADTRSEQSKERESSHDGEDSRREQSEEREMSHHGVDLREQSKERKRSHDGEDSRRQQSEEREKIHDGADLRREQSKEKESSHDGEDSRRERSKERERSHDGEDCRRERSKERENSHDVVDSRREQNEERDDSKSENEDHDSDKDRVKGRSKGKHRGNVQESEKVADWDEYPRDKRP
ncbi:uncharacterized protein phf3 isoform X2 [Scyliorhinus torazame]